MSGVRTGTGHSRSLRGLHRPPPALWRAAWFSDEDKCCLEHGSPDIGGPERPGAPVLPGRGRRRSLPLLRALTARCGGRWGADRKRGAPRGQTEQGSGSILSPRDS